MISRERYNRMMEFRDMEVLYSTPHVDDLMSVCCMNNQDSLLDANNC
jgi:hypothetical protein